MKTETLDKYITHYILKLKYRNYDIDGAPFKIGDHVEVLNNPNDDDTFNYSFSNKQGVVTYFEYDGGCGQSFPEDPMIGVKFSNGKIGEFWKEELVLLEK